MVDPSRCSIPPRAQDAVVEVRAPDDGVVLLFHAFSSIPKGARLLSMMTNIAPAVAYLRYPRLRRFSTYSFGSTRGSRARAPSPPRRHRLAVGGARREEIAAHAPRDLARRRERREPRGPSGARSAGANVAFRASRARAAPRAATTPPLSCRPASRTRTRRSGAGARPGPRGTRARSPSPPSGPRRARRGPRRRARGRRGRTRGCRAPGGREARGAGSPARQASRNAASAKASRPRASATRRSSEPGSGATRGARRAARSAASAGQPSPASDRARAGGEEEVISEDRPAAVLGRVRRPPVHRERRNPAAARDLPERRARAARRP